MTILSESDPIPISLVAHTVFCPRRTWLEAVGEKVDSEAMAAGFIAHGGVDRRVDDRMKARRSVEVVSHRLGLIGKCDVVQAGLDGRLEVVEFKASPLRRKAVVTEAQTVQLALQGHCLEEAGYIVSGYAVYFTNHHASVSVLVDSAVRMRATELVAQTRRIVSSETAPPPLVGDLRCGRCSHAGVCLPEERAEAPIRGQIRVSDPLGETLHLTVPGSRASLSHGRIEVVRSDETLASLPIERVNSVVVQGNVDLSSGLLRDLMWRGIPTVWTTYRGSVVGAALSARTPNGQARVRQHVASADGNLELARELVAAKIANQATQLRRGARDDVSDVVVQLRRLARDCSAAGSVPEIFGSEGPAASLYFSRFPSLLAVPRGGPFLNTWPGRQGRGADDPLNVALNLAYGLLLADSVRAVHACGLDPHAGFVHSSSRNKPALALDLMEQFRPPVADSAVLNAINNGELRPSMFATALGGWRLRDVGRKALVTAYERRVTQQFRHPIFGYQVTWRRAIEVQARMVLGVLDGTQPIYKGIRIR